MTTTNGEIDSGHSLHSNLYLPENNLQSGVRRDDAVAFRRNHYAGTPVNSEHERKNMGDRSPKSNQKKSNQKQNKNNAASQKKQQAVAAKQAAGKKK